MKNSVCQLFDIEIPIIQAGMVWCSGWRLAAAVSKAGGLGIIGAGSMHPEVLMHHIQSLKADTDKPFAVNVPLLYPEIDRLMDVIIQQEVPIVFTSAGNPKSWTPKLKEAGIKVVHVVSSVKFALKAEAAGVDAIVAEGFEAGGHNGREETTTLCLIPMVADAVQIPVIAAGGIGSGRAVLAAMALGADAVQVGSLFAAAAESSAHDHFKSLLVEAGEGATELVLKKATPVRLLKNDFYQQIKEMEIAGASAEELRGHLGKGRAKKGMFEGALSEGELEIGQVVAMIKEVAPAAKILKDLWEEFLQEKLKLANL
ncbi:nitronate monooxygenase family protein [Persicobacter sp. CCB-QB2]|uniref:NAD(P)H-dependent flavin oxidoreductase n=1 Tax=Persicobacter sp. CCB-QB2 TaxID=1561025 RepID=UPI0006A96A3F|nr:nitronate monooxygenase [Persicobacter sp. CCB-QB2]